MSALVAAKRATVLRRAAIRATLAPSVHNTQPWRFHLRDGQLDVFVDRTRQLTVLDPTTRQMIISCGCAVMNARVAMAGEGVGLEVRRHPDPAQPDLLASLVPADEPPDDDLASLDPAIEVRQTNRREFVADDVPPDLLEMLEAAATAEGAALVVVRDPDKRVAVAALSQHADDVENLNPAYRAELRAWTADGAVRRDGAPDLTVPYVSGTSPDEISIRDIDPRGSGGASSTARSSKDQCLVLLCTSTDTPGDWLRAGEALERVLLEIARHGFAASALTQIAEVPSARAELRRELALTGFPHVLLRIGRAPATPASRRRRLVDMLLEEN